MDNEALDYIEFETEDGNTIRYQCLRYFFYNGQEYALLKDEAGESLIVQVEESEDGETEELTPVDEDLASRLLPMAENPHSQEGL